MSKVLVSVPLLSSGVGNGRGAGGVSEGGDWREGEITGFSHLANCTVYSYSVQQMQQLVKASTGTVLHLLHVAALS